MYTDIFSRIKEAVSMQDVANRYGFEVDRAANMICPFHNDSHPSLHIYPSERGWHCFVCNAGGSVIDFVKKLFNLDARQAAIRLDNDFHLGLTQQKSDQAEELKWIRERKREQAEIEAYRTECIDKAHDAYLIRTVPKPPINSPLWGEYAALMGKLDYLDNYYFSHHEWK